MKTRNRLKMCMLTIFQNEDLRCQTGLHTLPNVVHHCHWLEKYVLEQTSVTFSKPKVLVSTSDLAALLHKRSYITFSSCAKMACISASKKSMSVKYCNNNNYDHNMYLSTSKMSPLLAAQTATIYVLNIICLKKFWQLNRCNKN